MQGICKKGHKHERHDGVWLCDRGVSRFAILGCMLLVSAFPMSGRCDVVEVNARLGRGINMGNMFEAPSEDAWGNPWQSGYFKLIAELGFQHVRLPVRWEPVDWSLAEAPYTIRPDSLVFELLNEPRRNGVPCWPRA